MSYTILYRCLAVKIADRGNYLVFVQSGDNNVYDVDPLNRREKRSRSWEAWCFGTGSPFVTRDTVGKWLAARLAKAKDCAKDPEFNHSPTANFGFYASVAIYGRHTSGTTFGAVKNFFWKALDKAISFDDFIRFSHGIAAHTYRKAPGEAWGHFDTTKPVSSAEKVLTLWETTKPTCESLWLQPFSTQHLENLADLLTSPRGSYHIKARFDGDGHAAYIKTLLPLTTTDNAGEAMAFPKSTIENCGAFNIVRTLRPDLKGMSYENNK